MLKKYWQYIYPVFFGLSYSQRPLFTSNQNTKFISGLASANYGDLASDWMAGITDPFPLFSYFLNLQYQIFGLYFGVHFTFFILISLYGYIGVSVAKLIIGNIQNKERILILYSVFWLIIHNSEIRPLYFNVFPDGLARQYLIGSYYQPCVFGIFVLFGIAAYVKRHISLAVICFLFATIIHPTYIFSCGLIAITLIFLPANRDLGISWKNRCMFAGIILIFLTFYAFWTQDILSSGNNQIRQQAHLILSKEFIPFHSIPSQWNIRRTLTLISTGFLAYFLYRKLIFGQLILGLFIFLLPLTLFSHYFFNPTLALIAPWRVSVFIAPISWMLILLSLAKFLTHYLESRKNLNYLVSNPVFLIIISAFSVLGMFRFQKEYNKKPQKPYFSISKFLSSIHEKGNQYLVPLDQMEIRLEAAVPVFTTTKSYPNKDSEFLIWYERYKVADKIYKNKMDKFEITELLVENSISHIVWSNSNGNFQYPIIADQIYKDDFFSVWKVGLNK